MKSIKFLVFLILFLVSNIQGMESNPAASYAQECLSCSRWDTLRWRFQFYRKGWDAKKRDVLLTKLVKDYDPKNIFLIHRIMCSNKALIKEGSRVWGNWESGYTHFNVHAFNGAVESNNLPVVKLFLSNLAIERYSLAYYFEVAIGASQEMTKALVDDGADPLCPTRENIPAPFHCTSEPGCEYYKKAVQRALEQRRDAVERENRMLRDFCNK